MNVSTNPKITGIHNPDYDAPRILGREAFLWGDSHTLRNFNIVPGTPSVGYQANGFFTWANALSRAAYIPTGVVADSGKTSVFLNTNYMQEMLASTASIIFALTGTNDCYNGGAGAGVYDIALTKDAWQLFWDEAASQGKTVYQCTIPPCNLANFDYIAQHNLNTWLLDKALTQRNLIVADISSVMTNPASATGQAKAGYLDADATHFSKLGAYYAGKELARVLAQYAPIADTLVYSIASTGTTTASARKFVNAGLGQGTAGTKSGFAGATGNIPGTVAGDLWDISGTGANVTVIANTIAAHTVAGNYWNLDYTTTAVGQHIILSPSTTNWVQMLAVDDWVCFEMEMKLIAGTTGISCPWVRFATTDGGIIRYYDWCFAYETSIAMPENCTLTIRTPPHRVRSTAGLAIAACVVQAYVGGSGTASMQIARASIRKLNIPANTETL